MSQRKQLLQLIAEVEKRVQNELQMYEVHKRYFTSLFIKHPMLFDGVFLSSFFAGWFFEKHHGLRKKLQRGLKLFALAAINSVRNRYLLN